MHSMVCNVLSASQFMLLFTVSTISYGSLILSVEQSSESAYIYCNSTGIFYSFFTARLCLPDNIPLYSSKQLLQLCQQHH